MDHCYYHSQKPAEYLCNQCHKKVCSSCIILIEGEPYCQLCWDGFVARLNQNDQEEKVQFSIPWLKRRELGFFPAFYRTAQQVVFEPKVFFSSIPGSADYSTPLLFAIICILLFWFPMNLFYLQAFPPFLAQLQAMSEMEGSIPDNDPTKQRINQLQDRLQSSSYAVILTMPLDFMIYYILLASFFQHLLISLLSGKKGYRATFEIRCYAMIAQCLQLIPVLGFFLTELVSVIVCTRGFQIAQKLTLPQALIVACVPIAITILPILTTVFSML